MRDFRFWFVFIVLTAAQVVLASCFNFSQLVMATILPVMILCIPIRYDSIPAIIVAFVAGFAVDFFSSGMLGLCSAALLPVALLRVPILKLVFGGEIFSRKEDISMARQGIVKMTMAILLATGLFLIVYLWLDAAGTRSFWFQTGKFILSMIASYICSLLALQSLSPDNNSRWI